LNEQTSGGRDARDTRPQLDEFPRTDDAYCFVSAQRFVDIGAWRECEAQCRCILERLRGSLPGVGQDGMGGIAEQCNSAGSPFQKRVTFEQWVVSHFVRFC
jgi:hypothetical protein